MKKLNLVFFCVVVLLTTTEGLAQGALNWNQKTTIPVHKTSNDPGATTAFGRLWISFAGTDSNKTVNVLSSADGFLFNGGPGPIIGKRSRYGVRIASQCGNLYVAYAGTDGSVNVTESVNGGATWPFQVVIGSAETSPTITNLGSDLGVVWGNGNFGLPLTAFASLVGCNLSSIGTFFADASDIIGAPAWDAGDARGFSRPGGFMSMEFKFGPSGPQFNFNLSSSNSGPFLVYNPGSGHHYVAWRGLDNRINVGNLNTGAHLVSSDTTSSTPALAIFNNQLFVVWRRTDNRINVGSTNLF